MPPCPALSLVARLRRRPHLPLHVSRRGVRLRRLDAEGHLVSVILVIQPDTAQAQRAARRGPHESAPSSSSWIRPNARVEAIARQVPDLILAERVPLARETRTRSWPRLRSLEGASHLQTVTIPQFRSNKEHHVSEEVCIRLRQEEEACCRGRGRSHRVRRGSRSAAYPRERDPQPSGHGRTNRRDHRAAGSSPLGACLGCHLPGRAGRSCRAGRPRDRVGVEIQRRADGLCIIRIRVRSVSVDCRDRRDRCGEPGAGLS